jgi:hypothetical protein
MLKLELLEDRTVPSFSPFQNPGGLSIAIGDVFPEVGGGPVRNEIVMGSGPGQLPFVRVFNFQGTLEAEFLAYDPSFTGGVNVAIGDLVGGDGLVEIVTGTGPGGGPLVKVFDLNSRQPVREFLAYESSFRGGVNVSTGDFDFFRPGDEVVTGPGAGGGPVVRTFTSSGQVLSSFFAYEPTFRFGVNVAGGDVIQFSLSPGDEIVTGPGEGGAPLLKVFSPSGGQLRSFFAFDFQSRNGLVVAVGNTENAFSDEIFAAEMFTPLTQDVRVRAFSGDTTQIESDFTVYPAGFTRYINMAAGDITFFNIVGDFAAVAGEGPTSQVPRIFFGIPGSAAGNNGP